MDSIPNGLEEQNSCGIRKIMDCKLSNDGRQYYKVKWEPTWEPAENLVTCQHLVDEFWSHVNKLKRKEDIAMQYQKKIKLELDNLSYNKGDFPLLSTDSKGDVQKLIAQASGTPVGLTDLQAPSDILASFQFSPGKVFDPSKPKKNNIGNGFSPQKSGNSNGKASSASSLKYLENFDNPFVKVIVVCKICNKEQSLKHTHHWKLHHQIHSNEKPYKCPHCPSAFKRSDYLRSHVQGKHSHEVQTKQQVKQEPF